MGGGGVYEAPLLLLLLVHVSGPLSPLPPPLIQAAGVAGFFTLSACHELMHSSKKPSQAVADIALAWMWWSVFPR